MYTKKSKKDQLQTTEKPTWTHTNINLEASKTLVAINNTATAQITTQKKPRKHNNCIQKEAHTNTHLNTRSQKKQVAISDTASHKAQHAIRLILRKKFKEKFQG
jgi:hypothetical protein